MANIDVVPKRTTNAWLWWIVAAINAWVGDDARVEQHPQWTEHWRVRETDVHRQHPTRKVEKEELPAVTAPTDFHAAVATRNSIRSFGMLSRSASAPLDDVPAAIAAAHHRNCRRNDHVACGGRRILQCGALSKVHTKHLATTAAALAGDLDDLRRETFVSMREAADLRNGGYASDWWADRPGVRRVLAE